MEKTNVPYDKWPEWIKSLTAFYYKPIMKSIKTPKSARSMSYLSFLVGIFAIAESTEQIEGLTDTPFGQRMKFVLIFGGILNLVLGILNWHYNYKAHLWVYENSSWEERFANKSSKENQLQYLMGLLAITVITLAGTSLFYL